MNLRSSFFILDGKIFCSASFEYIDDAAKLLDLLDEAREYAVENGLEVSRVWVSETDFDTVLLKFE